MVGAKKKDRLAAASPKSDYAINTTASLGVREALSAGVTSNAAPAKKSADHKRHGKPDARDRSGSRAIIGK